MIDTYLKSKNKAALDEIKRSVLNMIDPVQGIPATPEQVDESGAVTLAQPAIGDPAYWYTCVRAAFSIHAYDDVEETTKDDAEPICGAFK